MTIPARRTSALVPLAAILLAACGGASPPPEAPRPAPAPAADAPRPEPAPAPSPAPAARSGYTEADVRFLQGMIGHHAQAVVMTALVPERSSREDVRMLAKRIELSQDDEMRFMRRWLSERGEEIPDPEAHHHAAAGHAARMPGMLTQEELDRLAASRGPEFDRLFLEAMIRHHEGALTMVKQLFSVPGAGQQGEIFDFAAHVDSDQRVEIARMLRMLGSP